MQNTFPDAEIQTDESSIQPCAVYSDDDEDDESALEQVNTIIQRVYDSGECWNT